MSLKAKPSLQCGFSLIELMLAVMVIAIGLLGNAAMQALSLNNTAIARNRSLGAIEADALASMMHSNIGYWQSTAVPSTAFSITGTPANQGGTYQSTVLSNATLTNQQGTDCIANPCTGGTTTGVQMAAYDLSQWGFSVANLLPTGTGNVSCSVTIAGGVLTSPVSCVITVSWTENNNLMLNQANASLTQSYTLVVQP